MLPLFPSFLVSGTIGYTIGLNTKNSFISRESYADVLLSCHFAVIVICYQRDKFPHLSCNLQDTGTDCVEHFFSINGQWVGNRHNYTFADLR